MSEKFIYLMQDEHGDEGWIYKYDTERNVLIEEINEWVIPLQNETTEYINSFFIIPKHEFDLILRLIKMYSWVDNKNCGVTDEDILDSTHEHINRILKTKEYRQNKFNK